MLNYKPKRFFFLDSGNVQLILTGFDLSDNDDRNANYFDVLPDFHNGSTCSLPVNGMVLDCGMLFESHYYYDTMDFFDDNESDPSEMIISLTKLADGSNYT